jgi:hypothetical protein
MRASAAAVALGLVLVALLAPAAAMAAAPPFPTLVEIRAAHHPGFDRIVFEFEGGLPERTTARWVDRVTRDPSGLRLAVHGNAFIGVVLQGVTAHEESPGFASTFGPRRRAFDLPNIAHVAQAGDFEAVVSFGIGLMARTRILRRARLGDPDRFVVDVSTRFEKDRVPVAFLDADALESGTPPFLDSVSRSVPTSSRARSALHRLWAGPTQADRLSGLRFRASGTTGFRDFGVARGIARLTLTGRCDGGGETLTVADEVFATLKPFARIDWVKILDRSGGTQHPFGRRDSIPTCLAP